MTVSSTWPYASGSKSESDEHVRLKGMAVYWLLTRGFDLENIEEEHPVPDPAVSGPGSHGYTDIYAEQDGQEVFVECETGNVTLSKGGSLPAEEGKAVFVFTEDGIYRIEKEIQEYEPSISVASGGGTLEREELVLKEMSPLPMVDLSAYK